METLTENRGGWNDAGEIRLVLNFDDKYSPLFRNLGSQCLRRKRLQGSYSLLLLSS